MISDNLSYKEAEAILEQMAEAAPRDRPEFASLDDALAEAESRPPPSAELPAPRRDFARPAWNERLFESLFESVPDALVISDSQGVVVLVNGRTEKLFGYRREELLGRGIEILLPKRFRSQWRN